MIAKAKPDGYSLAATTDSAIIKELEIYSPKTFSGDELRDVLVRSDKVNEELFKKLGIGIK